MLSYVGPPTAASSQSEDRTTSSRSFHLANHELSPDVRGIPLSYRILPSMYFAEKGGEGTGLAVSARTASSSWCVVVLST